MDDAEILLNLQPLAQPGMIWVRVDMTEEQTGDLQVLADLRAWHRRQIEQALGDTRVVQAHEQAILRLHQLSAIKRQRAAEDEADRQRARAANSQTGIPQT
ncbi:hypothetical protein MKK63_00035 [Methylobacterium sp. J-088]|uniref:hypothetical protein n=1 Tax=Methylobacterium sp. J-088 TaxID=2836664 RepID=UPI001FBA82A2|nr:hypothetical protein [Methylobacterium sp. J-088]MCJ2061119.1 hypothetical protein [Methylobacterium sp. J-088]